MSIVSNDEILSSEVVAELKATNNHPYLYFSGEAFPSDFASLENSESVYSVAMQKPNLDTRKKIFQSSPLAQENFTNYANIENGVPNVLADLKNDPRVPVASFADLSTFVVNAFLKQTNARFSEFIVLKNVPNTGYKERQSIFRHALLTDAAIKSENSPSNPFPGYYVNNQNEFSRQIISSCDDFWNALDDTNKNNIAGLKPNTIRQPISSQENIDAERVNNLIFKVYTATQYIANSLTCLFAEFDATLSCNVIYHSANNDNVTVTNVVPYYSRYEIKSYSSVFEDNADASDEGWATYKEGPFNTEYRSGNSIYPDVPTIDLWPVVIKTVTYYVFQDQTHNYAQTKSQSAIDSAQRPAYVRFRQKENDYTVKELVKLNTENFLLPNCNSYFVKTANAPSEFSFLGWKKYQSSENNIVDYDLNNLQTTLRIDSDREFMAMYFVPAPSPYNNAEVDLRIKNNYDAHAEDNTQQQPFSIRIPLSGPCQYDGINGQYTLIKDDNTAINVGNLGLVANNNVDVIRQVTIMVKVTGNTQHAGYFTIDAYNDNTLIGTSGQHNFKPAETNVNQDNFGNSAPGKRWDFVNGSYDAYSFTFNFTNNTSVQYLNKCYLRVYGQTGFSTDDINGYYPYRCRFDLVVTGAAAGNVY